MATKIKLGTDGNWAVKENALLAYNDENSIFKPLDMTFDRDSGATRVNEKGLIETVDSNVPRLNYPLIDGVVSGCPSLLLEPQRSNLLTYSEAFDNTYWVKSGSSVVSGQSAPSVDFPTGAFKLIEDTNVGTHGLSKILLSPNGNTHTVSLYVKKGERTQLTIYCGGNFTESSTFNLEDGTSIDNGTSTSKIEFISDGWYKCSVTSINKVIGTYIFINNGGTSYTGDGTSGLYIYGAQLEAGSYATSYIPTSGATATRNAETASKANISNLINSSEGVLYAEMSALADDGGFRDIRLNDGTSNNRVAIRYSFTTNEIQVYVVSNGTETFKGEHISQSIVDFNKIAIKYKNNDFSLWVNGLEIVANQGKNGGGTPVNLNNINFSTSLFNFYGKVKDLRVYNTVLTDQELIALTS